MYHRTIFRGCRAISLLVALIASGCQTASHRPDFIARSEEDCVRGDESACSMMDALYPSLVITGSQSRTKPDQIQLERNVAAIMDGMKKARTYSPVAQIEIAPRVPQERLPIR
jgi:hypothetical protein